jgi:hypothetical protein
MTALVPLFGHLLVIFVGLSLAGVVRRQQVGGTAARSAGNFRIAG